MTWQVEVELGGYDLAGGWLSQVAERVLVEERVKPPAAVSIVLSDEVAMIALNQRYLGRPEVTDVLAFPLGSDGSFVLPPRGIPYLGEVIICHPQAVRQAREQGHSVKREIALLLSHGLLHLLGFDDGDEVRTAEMRREESRLLSLFPDLGDRV
ncbi:MAG: rRNA maturation RNase YbeY [Chloroflexota bacterium]